MTDNAILATYEKGLVGALAIDLRAMRKIADTLEPQHFVTRLCADIYAAALTAYSTGESFDAMSAAKVAASSLGEKAAVDYIKQAMDIAPTSSNLVPWAKEIRKAAQGRDLTASISEVLQLAAEAPIDAASEICDICKSFLKDQNPARMQNMRQIMLDLYRSKSEERSEIRVDTGFAKLDAILQGMCGGNLIVVGARTNVGKSAFTLNLAHNAASAGHTVLIYSLEMSAQEIGERLVAKSALTMDDITNLSPTNGSVEKWREVRDACTVLSKLPIIVNDDPSTTVNRIRAQAHTIPDLHLIIVDFLTLMRSEKRYESRQLEVGALSRELKLLAAELQIPIIAICQLNRGKDAFEAPTLRDLRDSGEIEQNANKVMLLYNTGDNTDPSTPIIGCIVDKNRRGRKGAVRFYFDGPHMRFSELAEMDMPKPQPQRRRIFND